MLPITSPRYSLLVLGCFLALLPAAGCTTDQAVIQQAEQVHGGLKPAVMADAQVATYLQTIGERVVAAARTLDAQQFGPDSHRSEDSSWMFNSQVHFHLVNSKTLNAFTTGGEHVYIYNELFQDCSNEDELAAVVSHEFGHVYARHVHKGMNRQMAITGGIAALTGAGYVAGGKDNGEAYAQTFATAATAAGQFIGMSYTRGDEAEADSLGFAFYCHAGWDPQHFGDFFQYLIDKGYDTTPELQSDHPTSKSRVAAAKQAAAQLPPEAAQWRRPPVASPAQFVQFRTRAAQLAKSVPTDESLQKAQTLLSAFPSCVAPQDQPDQKSARQRLNEMFQAKPTPAH
jgi:predicted Zn-dependent protease